jgi:hypothetical protein
MFEGVLRQFLKHWALWALGNSSAIHACGCHYANRNLLASMGPDVFLACLKMHPMELRDLWHSTTGQRVPIEDIGRVSPLAYAHVIPSGTYHFKVTRAPSDAPGG